MKNETQRLRHGFRCSRRDVIVLLCSSVLTVWLRFVDFPLWWIVAMALGHFFLFCNVFLVWQKWELLWAAVFIVNVMIHLALSRVEVVSVLLWQLPVTILVIVWQIRSPWYHGIFAQRWNPRLKAYLDGTL